MKYYLKSEGPGRTTVRNAETDREVFAVSAWDNPRASEEAEKSIADFCKLNGYDDLDEYKTFLNS